MKIYAIIVTIVAVVALSILGYGVWAGNKMAKSIKTLQGQISSLKSQAGDAEILSRVARDSASTFIQPGDWKIISFDQTKLSEIEVNIQNLADEKTKIEITNSWSKFKSSGLINDYRSFIQVVSDNITSRISVLK